MQKLIFTALLAASSSLIAQDCSNLGIPLGVGDEVVFPIQPIGFAFPLGATTYTDIHVCTNGYVFLSNAGLPAPGPSDYTATPAELVGDSPRIAALWTDLNIDAAVGGEVYIENTTGVDCVITWKNARHYGAATGDPVFDIQAKLNISGQIEFFYSPAATNNSAAGNPTWQVGITGLTNGQGVALPAMSDLSAGGATTDPDTLFEEWLVPASFDMNADSLIITPSAPGWAFATGGQNTNCANVSTYGTGCVAIPDAAYEYWAGTPWDLTTSTVTFIRGGSEYLIIDGIPATFYTPTTTTPLMTGDDSFASVILSQPIPIPGGTTSNLVACSNGYLTLSAQDQGADYSPSVADFEAFAEPTICGNWYDYNPGAGGLITFEENNGFAYITYDSVPPYGQTTGETWQYQIDLSSGIITVVYVSVIHGGTNGWHNPLFGATPGNAQRAESYDMSTALAVGVTASDIGRAPLALSGSSPILGGNWDLATSNLDPVSPIAITFFGSAQFSLPLNFIFSNADPACNVNIDTILGDLTALNTGGVATGSFPLPNTPGLAGFVITGQSICLTLQNGSNLLTSNGIQGVLGY